jgi:hypothetical protein
VELVTFEEATGRLLGPPEVRVFESDTGKNFASQFHSGVADNIPHGIYRLEAFVPGYSAELRYVLINQARATVILGMPVSPIESVPFPAIRGHILGSAPPKRSFIRLVGIYSGQVMESAIEPDGTFGFAAVRCCRYLLLLMGDGGTLASKDLTISDATLAGKIAVRLETPPLEIEISRAP